MKKINKWIALSLALSMVVPTTVQANTEHTKSINIEDINNEESIMPIFTYINLINTSVDISKSGIATVMGSVKAIKTEKVSTTVRLQQFKNNKWQTLYTWSDEDKYSCTVERSRAVPKGYSYRTQVTGKVYDAKGKVIEEVTVHSTSQYY